MTKVSVFFSDVHTDVPVRKTFRWRFTGFTDSSKQIMGEIVVDMKCETLSDSLPSRCTYRWSQVGAVSDCQNISTDTSFSISFSKTGEYGIDKEGNCKTECRNRRLPYISWIVLFRFSSRTGKESIELSDGLVLNNLPGIQVGVKER